MSKVGPAPTRCEVDHGNISNLAVSREKKRNFASSFRPIIICLSIFGIDFKWQEQRSWLSQLLIYCSISFWVLVNTSVFVYAMTTINEEGKPPETLLDYCFFYGSVFADYVQIVGTYVAIVLATWQHGGQLVKAFQMIENLFEINDQLYDQLRIISIVGVVLCIATVSFTYMIFVNSCPLTLVYTLGNGLSNLVHDILPNLYDRTRNLLQCYFDYLHIHKFVSGHVLRFCICAGYAIGGDSKTSRRCLANGS